MIKMRKFPKLPKVPEKVVDVAKQVGQVALNAAIQSTVWNGVAKLINHLDGSNKKRVACDDEDCCQRDKQ